MIDRTERFGSAEPPNHVVRWSSAEPPNQAFYRTEPNQVKYPNFGAIFGREEFLQKKWATKIIGILGILASIGEILKQKLHVKCYFCFTYERSYQFQFLGVFFNCEWFGSVRYWFGDFCSGSVFWFGRTNFSWFGRSLSLILNWHVSLSKWKITMKKLLHARIPKCA